MILFVIIPKGQLEHHLVKAWVISKAQESYYHDHFRGRMKHATSNMFLPWKSALPCCLYPGLCYNKTASGY